MRRLLLCCLPLFFTAAVSADSDTDRIRAALARALPDTKVDRITPSPIPGIYEVVSGTRIAYASGDGKYVLLGDLVKVDSQDNLTLSARKKLQRDAIEAIGEQNMLVIGPKDAKHTITVFTDVDCGYCARLHLDLPQLNTQGVRVRYLFFPQAGPGSSSYARAVSVWCAKDRVKAIGIAKAGGKLEARTCENPVDSHYALAMELGLRGTPAVILDDGRMPGGYIPAQQLLALLKQEGKSR